MASQRIPTPFSSPSLLPLFNSFPFLLFLLLTTTPSTTSAQQTGSTPGCPPNDNTIYSPFVPVSQSTYFRYTNETNNGCWWWAGCVFGEADPARNQQFASVALIMGLIPLTIKDIAWPERRLVDITRLLPGWLDVFVRAMGIVPSLTPTTTTKATTTTRERGRGEKEGKKAFASSRTYGWAMRQTRGALACLVVVAAAGLALGYVALALVETFSKRSSLGCPYPIFVLTWHLLAIVPAAVMTWLGKDEVEAMSPDVGSLQLDVEGDSREGLGVVNMDSRGALPTSSSSDGVSSSREDPKRVQIRSSTLSHRARAGRETAFSVGPHEEFSPIPGRGMNWLIQLCWAIYYIAGTLVYTSIMAVTVIELFVWVVVSVEVAAASKMLAFFLCILHEKRER